MRVMRVWLIFLLLEALAAGTAAAEELTLPLLLEEAAVSSPDWKREEAALLKARAVYAEKMAFISPALWFNAPAGFNVAYISSFPPTSSAGYSLYQTPYWVLSPGVSLTQLLPTMGTLDFSVSDNLFVIDPGAYVHPESYYPSLPETAFVNNLTVGLSIRQPIFFEDAFGASLKMIEEDYRLAQAGHRAAKNELVYQAARAYFTLRERSAARSLARLNLQDARLAYEDVKKKLGAGSVTRLAAQKEEARLKKAELDLHDASAAFTNEYALLAGRYGFRRSYTVGEAADAAALPEIPAAEECRARARVSNPELAMSRSEAESKKARVTALKCENAHTLTLGSHLVLNSAYDYSADLWAALAEPFNGSSNPRLSITFKLSFRLLDGGAADDRVRQAALDAEMSALGLAGKTADVAGRVESALAQAERARLNGEYAALSLAVAVQEYENAERDFRLGQISRLELDRLELARRSAELADLKAAGERDLARLEVFRLLGDDLAALLMAGKQPVNR